MKAIVRDANGPPDVLRLEEVQKPTPGAGEVLVRVHAASANAGDWHLVRGTPFPFRLVPGWSLPSRLRDLPAVLFERDAVRRGAAAYACVQRINCRDLVL